MKTVCHPFTHVMSNLSLCLSVCLSFNWSVLLFVCLSSCLFLSLYLFVIYLLMFCHICLSACHFLGQSILLSVSLPFFFCPSVCHLLKHVMPNLSVCLFLYFLYLSICLFIQLSVYHYIMPYQTVSPLLNSLSPALCACLFKCHQHLMSSLPACW